MYMVYIYICRGLVLVVPVKWSNVYTCINTVHVHVHHLLYSPF